MLALACHKLHFKIPIILLGKMLLPSFQVSPFITSTSHILLSLLAFSLPTSKKKKKIRANRSILCTQKQLVISTKEKDCALKLLGTDGNRNQGSLRTTRVWKTYTFRSSEDPLNVILKFFLYFYKNLLIVLKLF